MPQSLSWNLVVNLECWQQVLSQCWAFLKIVNKMMVLRISIFLENIRLDI